MHAYACNWESRLVKKQSNVGFGHLEGWFSSYGYCSSCGMLVWFRFVDYTSLIVLRRLSHMIVTPCHIFNPMDWWTWVSVGGGWLQAPNSVINEHPLTSSTILMEFPTSYDIHIYQYLGGIDCQVFIRHPLEENTTSWLVSNHLL